MTRGSILTISVIRLLQSMYKVTRPKKFISKQKHIFLSRIYNSCLEWPLTSPPFGLVYLCNINTQQESTQLLYYEVQNNFVSPQVLHRKARDGGNQQHSPNDFREVGNYWDVLNHEWKLYCLSIFLNLRDSFFLVSVTNSELGFVAVVKELSIYLGFTNVNVKYVFSFRKWQS